MVRADPLSSGITELTDAHFSEQTGKELSNSSDPCEVSTTKDACFYPLQHDLQ